MPTDAGGKSGEILTHHRHKSKRIFTTVPRHPKPVSHRPSPLYGPPACLFVAISACSTVMTAYFQVLGAVLQVFSVIGLGAVIRRLGWLSAEADRSIIRLIVNLFIPCLILDSVLGNPAMQSNRTLLVAPGIGVVSVLLGFLVAWWAAPLAGLRELRARRTFTFTTGLYNYGFVPIPLALVLFDSQTVSVLFLLMIGVEVTLWTIGLVVLTGGAGKGAWKRAINGPFLALVLGILLTRSGGHAHVPVFLTEVLGRIAPCAVPLALLMVGASIIDLIEPRGGWQGGRVMSVACGLRLVLLPAVFLLVVWLLPLPLELRRVLVLEAGMPSAVFPVVLARHYGGDTRIALQVVLGTAVVSLLTMPLWITFGLSLL
jgi:predicted permease